MKPSKWVYMHTLDGAPAVYEPGEQIYFVSTGRHRIADILVGDLKTIRAQQKASEAWRVQVGHGPTWARVGYLRFER